MTEQQVVSPPEDFSTAHRAALKQKQLTQFTDIFRKIKLGEKGEDTMDGKGFVA